jgi:hypothetical protein
MSYDFSPRNKEIESFHMGAFGFPILLKYCGRAIGYCEGIKPGTYYYAPDKKGRSPCDNDGYYVSAKDAKELAKRIREFLASNKVLRKEWDGYDEQTQKWMKDEKIYNIPILNDELLSSRAGSAFFERRKNVNL